jgi:hypothetical protein
MPMALPLCVPNMIVQERGELFPDSKKVDFNKRNLTWADGAVTSQMRPLMGSFGFRAPSDTGANRNLIMN